MEKTRLSQSTFRIPCSSAFPTVNTRSRASRLFFSIQQTVVGFELLGSAMRKRSFALLSLYVARSEQVLQKWGWFCARNGKIPPWHLKFPASGQNKRGRHSSGE